MISQYSEVVSFLESLQIMPKTMPGLQKIQKALDQTNWFSKIDPNKVIVAAGTNGKGTTCAALEALLLSAGQSVGFYSSPHLVNTTERLRLNGHNISEENFIFLFNNCEKLIRECELSHFEALTLMAGEYFFNQNNLDHVILEVGLGGLYDATNAFPHKYCMITKLGLDHVNILGSTLAEIAQNKFGIVGRKNIVVHHKLEEQLRDLKNETVKVTNSNWIESVDAQYLFENNRSYINYLGQKIEINLIGGRAAENISTAISTFEVLGFDLDSHKSALKKIDWSGRMQKVDLPNFSCPVYLSGDHNEQGVDSLVSILSGFTYERLYLVVGIGQDKDAASMLGKLKALQKVRLCLTTTPFKGLALDEYPKEFIDCAYLADENVGEVLTKLVGVVGPNDLVVVTGSLYLVGLVLTKLFQLS